MPRHPTSSTALTVMSLLFLRGQDSAAGSFSSESQIVSSGVSRLDRALQEAGTGLFDDIDPCEPLLSILGDAFDSDEVYGKFLEPPTKELLLACVEQSSLAIATGEEFSAAFTDPFPGVKVMQVQSSEPIVVPFTENILTPGAVTVMDCQDTWIDVRALPEIVEDEVEALTVFVRCMVFQDDFIEVAGTQTWVFDTSVSRPCTGDDEFTEENPDVVENATVVVGPFTLQNINGSEFCFTEEFEDEIFGRGPGSGMPGGGGYGEYGE